MLTKMVTKGYQNAKKVIFTNPDLKTLFNEIGIKDPIFMPLVTDATKYVPKQKPDDSIFTILVPSRQNWRIKASHHLIYAFASKNTNMRLLITEWGNDINRTKDLVKKLKLEKKVKYVPLVNKAQLIKRINTVDIVANQFGYGTYPFTSIEAMTFAKPVLVYINVNANTQCFGEVPPVVNCQSIQSIEEQILELYSDRKKIKSFEKKAGNRSKKSII